MPIRYTWWFYYATVAETTLAFVVSGQLNDKHLYNLTTTRRRQGTDEIRIKSPRTKKPKGRYLSPDGPPVTAFRFHRPQS